MKYPQENAYRLPNLIGDDGGDNNNNDTCPSSINTLPQIRPPSTANISNATSSSALPFSFTQYDHNFTPPSSSQFTSAFNEASITISQHNNNTDTITSSSSVNVGHVISSHDFINNDTNNNNNISAIIDEEDQQNLLLQRTTETLGEPTPPPVVDYQKLEQLLKKQKLKTRWLIREKATAYLSKSQEAYTIAIALRYIPFDVKRLNETPVCFRESLLLFLSQILLLYIFRFYDFSARHRRILFHWSKEFITTASNIMHIEIGSPAHMAAIDAISTFKNNTTSKNTNENETEEIAAGSDSKDKKSLWAAFFNKNLSESINENHLAAIQEILNPQPAKLNFLAQCDLFLKDKIVRTFEATLAQYRLIAEANNTSEDYDGKGREQKETDPWHNPLSVKTANNATSPATPVSKKIENHKLFSYSVPQLKISSSRSEDERKPDENIHQETFPLFPPPPVLVHCPPVPIVIMRDLLMMYISFNYYDARVQTVFELATEALDGYPLSLRTAVQELLAQDLAGSMRQDRKESPRTRNIRRLKIAGVAVGLGALTALTAGMAAPAIAAGFGALGIAGTSGAVTFLATAGGSATVASVFGAGTAGLTGWKFSRRIGKIKEFKFEQIGYIEKPTQDITPTNFSSGSEKPSSEDIPIITNNNNNNDYDDDNMSYEEDEDVLSSCLTHDPCTPLLDPKSILTSSAYQQKGMDHLEHLNIGESRMLDEPIQQQHQSIQPDDQNELRKIFNAYNNSPYNVTISEADDELSKDVIDNYDDISNDHIYKKFIVTSTTTGQEPCSSTITEPGSSSFLQNLTIDQYNNERKNSNTGSYHSTLSQTSSPRPLGSNHLCLTVTICVSGWLRRISDIWQPWETVSKSTSTVYALRWDPNVLLDLGNLVVTMLSQKVAVSAAQFWLQTTIAGALTVALMWPVAVMQYASSLDNAWMSCRERAMQAGRLLANALCDRKTIGIRPVTLIGFSMGARVIFACLLELRRREAFHLVKDVLFLGTPTSCDKARWEKVREVVSGRVVNVYSSTDWLLAFLYRYMEWGVTVAGLSPVKVDGVENFDVSGLVRNHNQYADKIPDILAFIDYHALPRHRILNIKNLN